MTERARPPEDIAPAEFFRRWAPEAVRSDPERRKKLDSLKARIQFDLAGGNIRNVALASAFLAAEQGGRIRMEHLVLSVGRELQKVGKLPSQTEFRHYYELIRQRC